MEGVEDFMRAKFNLELLSSCVGYKIPKSPMLTYEVKMAQEGVTKMPMSIEFFKRICSPKKIWLEQTKI